VAVKTEKFKKAAELRLSDGSHLKGSFFLYSQSPEHEGAELIFDTLHGKKRFIPMEVPGGDVVLIQKDCIVTAKLAEEEWVPDETYVKEIRVRVSLLSEERSLDGKIFVDLPEERSRLSDFFNHYKGFFYLNVDRAQHLVNFSFVKNVSHHKPS